MNQSHLGILLTTVVILLTTANPTQANTPPQKPNIILIMADDVGCDWFSCYGGGHKTPHLDKLAKNGIRFSTAWATPICTPTRHMLLTGRYPFRTGWIKHHDVPRWGNGYFDWEREITFARLLQMAGYVTAVGGKWQINDFRDQKKALAMHGFDEHCVWTGYETGNPPSGERYWNPYLQTNGKRKVHQGKFGPTVINEFLIEFIRRNKDRPFMVYYPQLMPHGPFIPTPLNKKNPPKKRTELYAGMVTYLDVLVGRIAETVEDLGIAENTIIIFTSDNGSSIPGRRFGMAWPRGKGRVTDAGAHVPFAVWAPMFGKKGRVCEDLVDFSDILPTFAELAGAKLPKDVKLDGVSFVGSLRGKGTAKSKRKWIYSQLGNKRMVRDQRYLLDSKGGFWDLKNDPTQKNDLRDSKKGAYVAARERLQAVLSSLPEDAPPPFMPFGKAGKKKK